MLFLFYATSREEKHKRKGKNKERKGGGEEEDGRQLARREEGIENKRKEKQRSEAAAKTGGSPSREMSTNALVLLLLWLPQPKPVSERCQIRGERKSYVKSRNKKEKWNNISIYAIRDCTKLCLIGHIALESVDSKNFPKTGKIELWKDSAKKLSH